MGVCMSEGRSSKRARKGLLSAKLSIKKITVLSVFLLILFVSLGAYASRTDGPEERPSEIAQESEGCMSYASATSLAVRETVGGADLRTLSYEGGPYHTGCAVTGGGGGGGGGGGAGEVSNTCNIGPLGWILCPVLNYMGGVSEGIYQWVETNFLATKMLFMSSDSGTRTAWGAFRDLANGIFVIVFLAVVISQITGFTNVRRLKELLPRLILAAVLINLSFLICQIFVDVSNIVGSQAFVMFTKWGDGILGGGTPQLFTEWISGTGAAGVAGGIIGVVLGVTVVGALAWANVGVLTIVMLAVVVSAFSIFVMLSLRQIAVVILVAISPVAFVCYVLPNTRVVFDKWLTLLKVMLLLYPVCGALAGAGYLAACMIQSVNGADLQAGDQWVEIDVSEFDTAGNEAGFKSWIMQMVAASLRFLPFLAVPFALKGAVRAAGKIETMVSGATLGRTGKVSVGASGPSEDGKVTSADRRIRTAGWMQKQASSSRGLRSYGGSGIGIPGLRRLIGRKSATVIEPSGGSVGPSGDRDSSSGGAVDLHSVNSNRIAIGNTKGMSALSVGAAISQAGESGNHKQTNSMLKSFDKMDRGQQMATVSALQNSPRTMAENYPARSFAEKAREDLANGKVSSFNWNQHIESGSAMAGASDKDYENLSKDVVNELMAAGGGASLDNEKIAGMIAKSQDKSSLTYVDALNAKGTDEKVSNVMSSITPEGFGKMSESTFNRLSTGQKTGENMASNASVINNMQVALTSDRMNVYMTVGKKNAMMAHTTGYNARKAAGRD